jgi:hypothetical protein
MHMDSLPTTPLQPTVPTGQNTLVPGLKSGIQTPTPTTKVLRWKDLEVAAIEGQGETPGTRTPFTIEEGFEVTSDGFEVRPDEDESDIEDLFV